MLGGSAAAMSPGPLVAEMISGPRRKPTSTQVCPSYQGTIIPPPTRPWCSSEAGTSAGESREKERSTKSMPLRSLVGWPTPLATPTVRRHPVRSTVVGQQSASGSSSPTVGNPAATSRHTAPS